MDVRSEILTQATRLFAMQGFAGTSIQQIAERVGIRKPSLLYHFKSKQELRREVIDQTLAHFQRVLPGLLIGAREQRFDAVMGSLVSFFADEPNRARLMVREILDRPEEMRGRLRSHVMPWVQLVGDQLERARERGLVHADVDVEAYAFQVITTLISNIAFTASLGESLPAHPEHGEGSERAIKEMLRMARVSLYVDPAQPPTP